MQDTDNSKNRKLAVDEKYLRPNRANELMKRASSIRQTVYICGATGFGKTSFVADFFSRRRYEYYSMEDSNIMDIPLPLQETEAKEGLKGKRSGERIIVVDDLQLLSIQEEREAGCKILKMLAEHEEIWLILISRSQIPAWLKPLYIQKIFVRLGERELSFTQKEIETYLKKWELEISENAFDKIAEISRGHPLFLRIAAMHLCVLKNESGKECGRDALSVIKAAQKDLWDYLEIHVYDQWNLELQEFLMDISCVEQFDLQLAQLITKKNDAGRLIAMAAETGNSFWRRKLQMV